MRAAQFLAIIGRGSKGSNALENTEDRAGDTSEQQDNVINTVNSLDPYRPSWQLVPGNVAAGTVYAQVPTSGTGDLAYTRGSTKTRTNAAGTVVDVASGVAAIDYRNADGSLSSTGRLLLELQRTNLALHSEDFTNAVWNKDGVTATANVVNSPDGYQNADSIVENTATSGHRILLTAGISGTGSSAYSFSVYVKKIEGQPTRHIYWMCQISGNAIYAHFNMTTFTVNQVASNGNGSGASASITPVGNNWYRLSLSGVVSTTTAQYFNQIYLETTPRTGFSSESYTGNGTSGYYVWGWQQEAGAYSSTYIRTTTAAVTRLADAASKTGISSLIGQTEGVFFVDFVAETPSENRRISLSDGTNSNRFVLTHLDSGKIQFTYLVAGSAQCNFITVPSYVKGQVLKIAFAYKQNDFVAYINGSETFTDNSGNVTTMSQIAFADATLSSPFIGSINDAALFTRRLTNAELAAITTL
jgi:hypothetical protein